jgi:5-methylcytosine-specific restriction endonuclease McrA
MEDKKIDYTGHQIYKTGKCKTCQNIRKLNGGICFSCRGKEFRRKLIENPIKWKAYKENEKNFQRSRRFDIRLLIFNVYGRKCVCCGEEILEFLTIDHINPSDKKSNLSGYRLYKQLAKENFPDGYQTLCYNCNTAKGLYGLCPHQKKKNRFRKELIGRIKNDRTNK